MKASHAMEATVRRLAAQHGLDLGRRGLYIRLALPHYDPLVIEVLHEHLVSVAHIYEPRPGLVQADPGIVFFTGYGLWLPVEIQQRVGGYRIYAALSPTLEDIESVHLAKQADLAGFADAWAAALALQGWLESATLVAGPAASEIPF